MKPRPTILIIDDNPDVIQALTVLFTLNQCDCLSASQAEQGLALLQTHAVDLVIQDMNFSSDTTSGEEGVALFHQIRTQCPDTPIILITAWTQLSTAIELVKLGAADYLSKPWDDQKLVTSVNNLLQLGQLQKEKRQLNRSAQKKKDDLANRYHLCGLQYESQTMYELLSIATQVAHSDASVLITGPNGTGKEKIAEIVQANSSVHQGPFIKVNVGALPNELMEAELFGAEAGAYTGITKRRIGRFERAHNGTLFLDEIGNLSLDGQAKLLRVLETGELERIGGSETINVNVRIISATNADLRKAIEAGNFREDLFYRLNVIELTLTPLCERKDDILPLANHFLTEGKQLSEDAQFALANYAWPGNIRELKNTIQRGCLLSPDTTIESTHLGLPALPSSTKAPAMPTTKEPSISAESLSLDTIKQAIDEADGVMSEAARLLRINRSALYRRIKKLESNAD